MSMIWGHDRKTKVEKTKVEKTKEQKMKKFFKLTKQNLQ
jgi:hypothetical protein